MYFNVNFNVFFKLIKVHLLVRKLYITSTCFERRYYCVYKAVGICHGFMLTGCWYPCSKHVEVNY